MGDDEGPSDENGPVMARLNAIIGTLVRAMACAATAAGILLTGFVALASFMRYLVGAPFAFTEEVVGLLFSSMVFLALPYCAYRGSDIRVTLVTDILPVPWRKYSAVASTMFSVVFCITFGWFAADFAWTTYALNGRSDIGRMLLWPWMAAMPLACLFMAVAAILRHYVRPPAGADSPSA